MSGPLSGIRILDFTRLLPGPFGTMMLADLGAEVWRVDGMGMGDLLSIMPPIDGDISVAHRQINRGKQSIVIDLKHPRGAEVVKRLCRACDVVMEQFRPGVMDRLGAGYEALRAENPRLVYCSITGYGQTGCCRDRAGHDLNYLALSGLSSFTGRRAHGPVPIGIQVADQCAGGQNAVIAVLAALLQRERTGQGQHIDISMTDGALYLGAVYASACLAGAGEPDLETTFLNGGGFYDCYATADGRYLAVAGLEPQFFSAMCDALGRPDLKAKPMTCAAEIQAVKKELAAEFSKKTRAEWEAVFARIDACVEPVLSMGEALQSTLVRDRDMVVEAERADGTRIKQLGSPFKFSAAPFCRPRAGERPGAHTDAVLAAGGFNAEEIAALRAEKAVK